MAQITKLTERNEKIIGYLLDIWETSVRETHTFLSENDICNIKSDVMPYLQKVKQLYCYYDENNDIQGFIGIENQKIEMLFVSAKAIGQGIGKQLLGYALEHFQIKYVDVNEQNEQAVGFYKHMGFHIIKRSEIDEQGRPFPILHLER